MMLLFVGKSRYWTWRDGKKYGLIPHEDRSSYPAIPPERTSSSSDFSSIHGKKGITPGRQTPGHIEAGYQSSYFDLDRDFPSPRLQHGRVAVSEIEI